MRPDKTLLRATTRAGSFECNADIIERTLNHLGLRPYSSHPPEDPLPLTAVQSHVEIVNFAGHWMVKRYFRGTVELSHG